ncbi:MAG: hypothetical protein JXR78_15320 [Victivallales bacterium]|nr:hypothetical protein [Victivallales bacterium]
MKNKCTADKFLKDVEKHKLETKIVLDNGLCRFLKFRKPETNNLYFNITTWPGYLCISGDMGTYVFARLPDMFDFFRSAELKINPCYWHEKLQAEDRHMKSTEYDPERFEREIKEIFFAWVREGNKDKKTRRKIWEEIQYLVLSHRDTEFEAYHAVNEFECLGFTFLDSSWGWRDYTYQFIWCLYAIVWGIQQYDKTPAEGVG